MTAPQNPPTPGPAPTAPAGPTNPATPPAPAATAPAGQQGNGQPADGDKPLGPNGEKALKAEREARVALEKRVQELEPLAQLAGNLKPLADMLGGKPTGNSKTDLEKLTERMGQLEQTAQQERLGRLRLEVAAEKGLTPQQAARLQGTDREQLAADADALRALFPTAPAAAGQPAANPAGQPGQPGTPPAGTPRPDPSQGAQPGGTVTTVDQAEQALKDGKVKDAIALKAAALTAPKQ